MNLFVKAINNMSEWTGRVVGFVWVAIVAMMLYEVIMRYLFASPTRWVHELSQYFFGFAVVTTAAYCLLHQAHVKVDLFYSRLSERGQAIVDSVTFCLFSLFVAALLYTSWKFAIIESVLKFERSTSPFHPYIWPFKLAIVLGLIMLWLQGVAKFIQDVHVAIKRRVPS